jgi:hypothetical protein
MNSLENWIRWHSLSETSVLNALTEGCYDFSDNNVTASDLTEDCCNKCVGWLEKNKNFIERTPASSV